MSATLQTTTRDFWPERVYVERAAAQDEIAQRVVSRLGGAQIIELEDPSDPNGEDAAKLRGENRVKSSTTYSRGKHELMLMRYRGNWLRACPGTSQHVCCNLWTVNPGEGCPLDCTYCYLQSYLRRNPTLKIFTNIPEMLAAIEQRTQEQPDRFFRIGTGEVIDSLVWDELTDLTHSLVPFFGRLPNGLLELKSKFDSVDNLVALRDEHRGNTVVSWSVNAECVTDRDEAMTASLDRRLHAAQRVIEAGYRVGLHFDPLIHFDNWQDHYQQAIEKIFRAVDPKRVAWVSVSTLRYRKEMQQVMVERFPESKLPFGEQFLAKDDKLRYIQPIRFQLVNFAWQEIKRVAGNVPLYMCMESAAAWRQVAGGAPAAGSELVEIFSRRGHKLPLQTGVEPQNWLQG